MLNRFTVVLVEPLNPINAGTVIRAMRNMGLKNLAFVSPRFEHGIEKALIAAHRCEDMIERCRYYDTLDQALADTHVSLAFTARTRSGTLPPVLCAEAFEQILPEMAERDLKCALVFGREESGLTNEEVERCDKAVRIPTALDYTSLNLAQAVLLACYELSTRTADFEKSVKNTMVSQCEKYLRNNERQSTFDSQNRLVIEAAKTLAAIGYFKSASPTGALTRLRDIVRRARLSESEIHLLMGMTKEIFNFASLIERGIKPANIQPELLRIAEDVCKNKLTP